MPSLKQLQYFCDLCHENNMSHLAAKLYISQTALSNAISRLEKEIDAELFDRTPYGLVPNRYGQIYLDYAEKILSMVDEASEAVKQERQAQNETLSIAMNSPLLYGELLTEFISRFPECVIIQRKAEINSIISSLPELNVDLVLAGKEDYDSPYLDSVVLSHDQVYVCVQKDHKFSNRSSIRLEECAQENFIYQDITTGFSQFSDRLFADAGIKPKIVAFCDYSMRKNLFKTNHGILLASDAIRRVNFFSDCVYIPLEPVVTRDMALFWRKNKVLPVPAENFKKLAIEFFSNSNM